MGVFDFLKVTVVEKTVVASYKAALTVDGKPLPVANLGMDSVTAGAPGKLKQGQRVTFALALTDPKESLSIRGTGVVASVDKAQAKIQFQGLPDQTRQQVARFLARYLINRPAS
ncbi:hypothetical protein [Rhodocista pekingensis]|uniref:PilZ domain-containing protein n=1 Tax=Rhodocista pekingensis TaxID=201185 RepID=A0ABW2KWW6_9PROT